MKKLSEKVMYNRLNAAFNADYQQYEQTASFFPIDEDNVWKFVIDELNQIITLTCDEQTGQVSSETVTIGKAYLDEDGVEYQYDLFGRKHYTDKKE